MLDDFSERDQSAIEGTTREVGRYLFDHLDARQPSVLQRQWWDDRIMDWAMRDDAVKVQMFRFVDVLPMLRDSRAVTEHLVEYLGEVRDRLPGPVRLALAMAKPGSVVGRALALAARRNAAAQAKRFIAGTTAEEVLSAAKRERRLRRAFTLDVLGEAVTSEIEADQYLNAYVSLIERMAPAVNAWPEVPQIDRGLFAELPRMNVSVKLSALDSRFDAIDPTGTTRRVAERLTQLLRVARRHRAFVNVDMESYKAKELTLAIFKDVLSRDEFRDLADVGIVIQCYLRDAVRDLVRLRDWAATRGTPVWVRLVKGAYWDYETTYAAAAGWPVPVYQEKWQSDTNFERATRFVFRNHQHLRPALGSHNLRSLAHGIATARHLGLPASGFELQMLYGMADAEKQVLVGMGHRLRIYMPYGELIPGMAYLVRRLLENTSNDSFLRASLSSDLPVDALLADPLEIGQQEQAGDRERARKSLDEPAPVIESVVTTRESEDEAMPGQTMKTFHNEPLTDFAVESNREAMQAALDVTKFGEYYPLRINGVAVRTAESFPSIDPSHRQRIVGTVAKAGPEHVEQAVAAASAALTEWSSRPVAERVEFLLRAADAMRRRRFELAALIVHECGKPWRESDGDVAEAIDFCEYYAAGAIELQTERGVNVPGEENMFEFIPRGVAAVIAPWNFPLAILTGMTVAALATGNTVVMKPAEQSSVIAAKLMEIFHELGLPPGVLNYLPGEGEVVGAGLVEHPDVALVAFTGSRDVGLAINAKAAEISTRGRGRMVKHVIAEMGGKNAIIVDEDADLDEAVLGVVHSAFGYQGQKCSACSRVIVLAKAYEPFLNRLVEATRTLQVGPAEDPATQIGPVIDGEALARVKRYIETSRTEGRVMLATDVGALEAEGFYVGPHVVADVSPDAKTAQEEVFGPLLVVMRAADMDDALRITNGTQYALTGGIFSRSPANLGRARREMAVGNLYLNRAITGALVSRQPFGGYRMSGIGSKAGGPEYLLQFVIGRTVTENTMRRGFAPEMPRGGSSNDSRQASAGL